MDYILTGEEKFVKTVLGICEHMVRRGDIKFIPITNAQVGIMVADDKIVGHPHDSKTPHIIDEKKPRKRKTKAE